MTRRPRHLQPRRSVLARARREDDGFAMATVLGAMFALSLVIAASLAYVTKEVANGRKSQDFQAAVAAAQAGVDDYLARLNSCDTYWQAPCATSAPDAALSGSWVTVPGSSTVTPAQYKYQLLSLPNSTATPGVIRLEATGKVGPAQRKIVVDLRKPGFLEYIYYTDKESSDPLSTLERYPARKVKVNFTANSRNYQELQFAGVTTDQANVCARRYYGTTATPGQRAGGGTEVVRGLRSGSTTVDNITTTSFGCDIQFADIDTISGRLHTNDAILLDNPLFKGRTTTSWPAGATPAPTPGAWYRKVNDGSGPQDVGGSGQTPEYAAEIPLPPDNRAVRDKTIASAGGQDGCLYTGATDITIRGSVMDVISPGTTSWNPGCQPGTGRPLPRNGVIYVDPLPTSRTCTGKAAGLYPVDGDITAYDCRKGDVFVKGTLDGQLTIASANDIVVTDDLKYSGGLTGDDVLGLIATDFVEVYHPVKCATAVATGYYCTPAPFLGGSNRDDFVNIAVKSGQPLTNVQIDAAILSVAHSFTVQNFDKGAKLGTLTVRGGIYQNYRGPVGTGGASTSGTGYGKNYVYDPRLIALPPPSFINPVSAQWRPVVFSEQ